MALCTLNLDAGTGCVLNAMRQHIYAQEEEPVPIVLGAGWTPGSVRMGSRREPVYPTQEFERKTSQPAASAVPATQFCAERIILKCILQNCDTGVLTRERGRNCSEDYIKTFRFNKVHMTFRLVDPLLPSQIGYISAPDLPYTLSLCMTE